MQQARVHQQRSTAAAAKVINNKPTSSNSSLDSHDHSRHGVVPPPEPQHTTASSSSSSFGHSPNVHGTDDDAMTMSGSATDSTASAFDSPPASSIMAHASVPNIGVSNGNGGVHPHTPRMRAVRSTVTPQMSPKTRRNVEAADGLVQLTNHLASSSSSQSSSSS
eukprot:TRINITY_DN66477_c8_g12_i1.p1 TRINITY_DN66477_c8_g12~~TRINITY_DN66477_c8_g12_i1.p1  ORF type:complete len:164 (+),score=71.93 TRINITY_DN66477_c8_g12_i1:98-589(+)